MDDNQWENKRDYYRVCLEKPLCGNVTIVECNGKSLNTGITKACIIDVGPGGLAFATKLDFPVEKNIIFLFTIRVDDKNIFFRGHIVWKKEVGEKPTYNYGVIFNMSETERSSACNVFNKLTIYIKKGYEEKYCSICNKKRYPCS